MLNIKIKYYKRDVLELENLKKFCKEKSITFFFPISLILTIVPLIVRVKEIKNNPETLAVFGAKAQSDLFSQNKALVLMIFSIAILVLSIIFFKKIFHKKDKVINSIVILSLIFLLLSLFSSIFSEYRKIAFFGIFDRAEGFITIACYILIFIYSIYTFNSTKNYRYLYIPLTIVVFINGFLGLFQFFGHDLLATSLGQIFANVDPKSITTLYDSGNLYGTLYHYNYVGSFAAIVIPILIGSLFHEDDIFLKLVLIAAIGSGFWLLFGSTSRAGLIGFAASILFAIIIFGKILINHLKPVIITLVSLLVILIVVNFATGGKVLKRIPTLFADAITLFKDTSNVDYKDYTPIRNIEHNEDGSVEITLQNEQLNISYENNQYVFKDSNNQIINYEKTTNSKDKTKLFTTTDNRFAFITFRYGPYLTKTKDDGLLLNINNKAAFMFVLKDDNTIHMINGNSKEDIELENPETIGFKGKEKIASSRGYIWSRTLPMLKDCLLLGKGPDTFVFNFPQNDLIGKLYAYDSATEIVDKPHDLYLQTAISNGVVALIAFLAIIIIYIVDSIKLYAFKTKFNESEIIGISTFLGVIGYLFAGIFNDSLISVAPIFWIVFGVGIAINYINRNTTKAK